MKIEYGKESNESNLRIRTYTLHVRHNRKCTYLGVLIILIYVFPECYRH